MAQRDAAPVRQRGDQPDAFVDDRTDVHRLQRQVDAAGLDLGQVQHFVDQFQQVLAGLEDFLHAVQVLAGQGGVVFHQLAEAENGVHGRAQLVAHAGEELGLSLVGAVGGLARGDQRQLGAHAVVDVLHHADHVQGLALGVALHRAALQQPAHGAVGPHHAVLHFVRFIVLDTGIDRVDHRLTVIRVHGGEKVVVGGFQIPQRITEQRRDTLGPEQVAADDVPLPGADVGVHLATAQAFLGRLGGLLGTAPFGDVVKTPHPPGECTAILQGL